jgi:nicotinamidase-related amidase
MPHPVLVVVDVQERLFNVMDADRRDDMVANVKILVSTARRLDVPMLVTEQYPKGLGRTLPELRALLGEVTPIEKTAFSCAGADGFLNRLHALERDHVILVGLEAHVCVLLTALDLLGHGLQVSIVADAVCSRRPANLEIGLAQARQAGAVITATETVVFQLLGSADSEAFRELSKLLR